MQGIGYCYFPFSYGKRIRVTGQACGIPEPLSYRDGAMAEKGDGGRRISEQIFGTNVLKIAVCIYTNKMLYGIIRVTFERLTLRSSLRMRWSILCPAILADFTICPASYAYSDSGGIKSGNIRFICRTFLIYFQRYYGGDICAK